MTIKEMREKCAEILGLSKQNIAEPDEDCYVYKIEPDGEFISNMPCYLINGEFEDIEDWTPDTNNDQIMMCLEWLEGKCDWLDVFYRRGCCCWFVYKDKTPGELSKIEGNEINEFAAETLNLAIMKAVIAEGAKQ